MRPNTQEGEIAEEARVTDSPAVSEDPVGRREAAQAVAASFFAMFCVVGITQRAIGLAQLGASAVLGLPGHRRPA